MKKKLPLLLPLALIAAVGQLIVRPARAEWEYTEWGMSVEEVRQASDGAAVLLETPKMTDDGTQTLLTSDWNPGQYQFEVLFNFSGSQPGLSEVVLISQGNTEGLVDELNQKFGRPTRAVGELRQTARPPGFTLIESETFARPAPPPSNVSSPSPENLSVLVEWKTPTNFIQLIRQSPTDVTIRLRPVQQ